MMNLQNVFMENVPQVENMKSLENVQRMLQIAANMKRFKNAAIQVAAPAVTVKGYAREDAANSY